LPLGTASLVWLSLKCVLAGILVWIWRKEFLRSVAPDVILVAALLGFDLALLWDLRTGNVALVEQALLWSALLAYVRGRFSIAAVLIGLASVFKLGPIVFLALFLSPLGDRNRVAPMVLGLVAFVSLTVVPLAPFKSWIHALTAALGQGSLTPNSDPSAPTVLGWVLSLAGSPPSSALWIQASLYGLFVIGVLSASVATLRRADRSFSPADRVVTAMVLWFLLSPRVMVYSYASAVVPALFVLYGTIQGRAWRLGAGLLLLLQAWIRFLPGQAPTWLGAVSFLIMVGTWALWVRRGAPSEA
jgi:hypothetical protein